MSDYRTNPGGAALTRARATLDRLSDSASTVADGEPPDGDLSQFALSVQTSVAEALRDIEIARGHVHPSEDLAFRAGLLEAALEKACGELDLALDFMEGSAADAGNTGAEVRAGFAASRKGVGTLRAIMEGKGPEWDAFLAKAKAKAAASA